MNWFHKLTCFLSAFFKRRSIRHNRDILRENQHPEPDKINASDDGAFTFSDFMGHCNLLSEKIPYETLLPKLAEEQGDFEREEIQLAPSDTGSLIEIVLTENSVPSFPRKFLTGFNIQTTKRLLRGKLVDDAPEGGGGREETAQPGVKILISKPVLESVQQIARSGDQVEQGGILVGDVYIDAASNDRKYIVEITAQIPAEETFANMVELRYTFESWKRQTSLLKVSFPGKRIVGWYHTHLDLVKRTYYTDDSRQSTYTTPLFFSQDDTFTHRQFFREKWYVAMVLDPAGNLTFYHWVGEEIGESRRFYVFDLERRE